MKIKRKSYQNALNKLIMEQEFLNTEETANRDLGAVMRWGFN